MAAADCFRPVDGMTIKESVTFCSDTFDLSNGITITGNDISIDCNTAVLRGGSRKSNIGVYIVEASNVSMIDCNIIDFHTGIFMENTTFSLVQGNGLLKNQIGIRLLESYENIIRDNNDKSRLKPVSAVSSKFNIISLGNKNLDEDFCDVNICNEVKDMNPCVSGDFYCSSRCSGETDEDCREIVIEPVKIEKSPTAEEIIQEVQNNQEQIEIVDEKEIKEKKVLPSDTKMWAYILTYLFAFIVCQLYAYRKLQ